MVQQNEIQKNLESDELIYMEGARNFKTLISENEIQEDRNELIQVEVFSACDFEEAYDERFAIKAEREEDTLGIFETSEYFDKIFPALQIQKPGQDYYSRTTLFLALCAVYVFMFYGKMDVDVNDYLKN